MNRIRIDGNTIFTLTLIFLLLVLAQSSAMSYARALPNSTLNPSYISEFAVPTPSSGPLAVATDRNGSVWFTESNSSKIGRYTPSTLQVTLGAGGTVTWCVDSNSIHSDTVTSDTGLFNSGAIA